MTDSDWLTWQQAAEVVGCPVSTIGWYRTQGRIEGRPRDGTRPSLRRDSVEKFATWWSRQKVKRVREARRRDERPEPKAGPPTGNEVWLDAGTAAAVLGLSSRRVSQLASAERLPATMHNGRWWMRRTDLETVAAARAFVSRVARSSPGVSSGCGRLRLHAVRDDHCLST